MLKRTLLAAGLLLPGTLLSRPAHADEFDGKPSLSSDDKATIQADQEDARKTINEKYKDDTSSDGRRARERELRQSEREVLQKHGVDEREYTKQSMHQDRNSVSEVKSKKEELHSKRTKDAEEAKKPKVAAKAEGEIEVVKGFSEENPMDLHGGEKKAPKAAPALDENGEPLPVVEAGLPAGEAGAAAPAGEDGMPPKGDKGGDKAGAGGADEGMSLKEAKQEAKKKHPKGRPQATMGDGEQ